VLWQDTNVSEVHAASIFRVKVTGDEENCTDIGLECRKTADARYIFSPSVKIPVALMTTCMMKHLTFHIR
jgi:hypothetical protein